jgi:hypothetical protein
MTSQTLPGRPLSIWHPVHLGTDEMGADVHVTLAERNMLIGGEPGGGKSVALQLIVAHGALSSDCKLILIDGKRVELGLWRECAEKFVGPSMDDAISVLGWLQESDQGAPSQACNCHPAQEPRRPGSRRPAHTRPLAFGRDPGDLQPRRPQGTARGALTKISDALGN